VAVFQAPQAAQRPNQRDSSLPHALQKKWGFVVPARAMVASQNTENRKYFWGFARTSSIRARSDFTEAARSV